MENEQPEMGPQEPDISSLIPELNSPRHGTIGDPPLSDVSSISLDPVHEQFEDKTRQQVKALEHALKEFQRKMQAEVETSQRARKQLMEEAQFVQKVGREQIADWNQQRLEMDKKLMDFTARASDVDHQLLTAHELTQEFQEQPEQFLSRMKKIEALLEHERIKSNKTQQDIARHSERLEELLRPGNEAVGELQKEIQGLQINLRVQESTSKEAADQTRKMEQEIQERIAELTKGLNLGTQTLKKLSGQAAPLLPRLAELEALSEDKHLKSQKAEQKAAEHRAHLENALQSKQETLDQLQKEIQTLQNSLRTQESWSKQGEKKTQETEQKTHSRILQLEKQIHVFLSRLDKFEALSTERSADLEGQFCSDHAVLKQLQEEARTLHNDLSTQEVKTEKKIEEARQAEQNDFERLQKKQDAIEMDFLAHRQAFKEARKKLQAHMQGFEGDLRAAAEKASASTKDIWTQGQLQEQGSVELRRLNDAVAKVASDLSSIEAKRSQAVIDLRTTVEKKIEEVEDKFKGLSMLVSQKTANWGPPQHLVQSATAVDRIDSRLTVLVWLALGLFIGLAVHFFLPGAKSAGETTPPMIQPVVEVPIIVHPVPRSPSALPKKPPPPKSKKIPPKKKVATPGFPAHKGLHQGN